MTIGSGPMVLLTSWPYDDIADSQRKATALFTALRDAAATDPSALPFRVAHELALIEARGWWMIAVGGLPDSSDTLDEAFRWYHTVPQFEQPVANEFHADEEGDLDSCITSNGWGRVVECVTVGTP